MMYENLLSILSDPLAIKLLEEQKINIFDLNNEFYTDICFHFDSPNGKDSTLQDRIKTFYPNITLCDSGCKIKEINLTTMRAECECTFQDLLNKNIFDNDLFRDNVLIKESLEEITEMLYNLNIKILVCYKDVFDYKYFKKNIGGFITIGIFILYSIFIIYYMSTKNNLLKYIYTLTKKFIAYNSHNSYKKIQNSPCFPIKKKKFSILNKDKIISKDKKYNIKIKNKEARRVLNTIIFNEKNDNKNKGNNKINRKINFKQINILNLNFNNIKNNKKYKVNSTFKSSSKLSKFIKNGTIFKNKNNIISKKSNSNSILLDNGIDIKKFIEPSFDGMDYDDIVEIDKRTFFQYFCEKIKEDQMIINTFFILDFIKPKSIKIAIFIMDINFYFLVNGLFYSDSYISELFNSSEEENLFSFVPRLVNRFVYSTIIIKIIGYIINFFFIEEIKIKNILLTNTNDLLNLKYEMTEILRSIIKRIRILIIINYIILIFSWYFLSCFSNVYPHIIREWILSSLLIFIIMQTIPLILALIGTCIRFISIRFESEKLFKLSLLLS